MSLRRRCTQRRRAKHAKLRGAVRPVTTSSVAKFATNLEVMARRCAHSPRRSERLPQSPSAASGPSLRGEPRGEPRALAVSARRGGGTFAVSRKRGSASAAARRQARRAGRSQRLIRSDTPTDRGCESEGDRDCGCHCETLAQLSQCGPKIALIAPEINPERGSIRHGVGTFQTPRCAHPARRPRRRGPPFHTSPPPRRTRHPALRPAQQSRAPRPSIKKKLGVHVGVGSFCAVGACPGFCPNARGAATAPCRTQGTGHCVVPAPRARS